MCNIYSRAARQQVTWLNAAECIKTNRIHATGVSSASAATVSSNYTSQNWSGWQIGGGSATANHYAQAGWNVPSVSIPAYSSGSVGGYESVIWVGLGGGLGITNYSIAHPLIQAGTDQNISQHGNADYYFWYEVYPQYSEIKIDPSLMPVGPGDEVGAVIGWNPGQSTATLGVCNWNTNTCTGYNVSNVGEPSNTTEWIVEAPENLAGTIQPLPSFTPVNFINGCWAATTTFSTTSIPNTPYSLSQAQNGTNGVTGSITGPCQSITAGPSLAWIDLYLSDLYSSATPLIATPSSIGSNGSNFTVNYQ